MPAKAASKDGVIEYLSMSGPTENSGRLSTSVAIVVVVIATIAVFLAGRSGTFAPPVSYLHLDKKTTPIASTTNAVLYCRNYRATESPCELFASIADGSLRSLGYAVDVPTRAVLVSPGRHAVLIIGETEAVVLSGATLAKVFDVHAPHGDTFGTYDAFPSFIPYGRWTGDTQFELSVFSHETPEPYANEAPAKPLNVEHFTLAPGSS